MDYINGKIKEVDEHLDIIDENLLKTYTSVGVVKYDAFKEVGGTLSFVLSYSFDKRKRWIHYEFDAQ